MRYRKNEELVVCVKYNRYLENKLKALGVKDMAELSDQDYSELIKDKHLSVTKIRV